MSNVTRRQQEAKPRDGDLRGFSQVFWRLNQLRIWLPAP
jgi:hypothetical protein